MVVERIKRLIGRGKEERKDYFSLDEEPFTSEEKEKLLEIPGNKEVYDFLWSFYSGKEKEPLFFPSQESYSSYFWLSCLYYSSSVLSPEAPVDLKLGSLSFMIDFLYWFERNDLFERKELYLGDFKKQGWGRVLLSPRFLYDEVKREGIPYLYLALYEKKGNPHFCDPWRALGLRERYKKATNRREQEFAERVPYSGPLAFLLLRLYESFYKSGRLRFIRDDKINEYRILFPFEIFLGMVFQNVRKRIEELKKQKIKSGSLQDNEALRQLLLGQTRHLLERTLFPLELFWLGVIFQKENPQEILLRKNRRFQEEALTVKISEQAEEMAKELFEKLRRLRREFMESCSNRLSYDEGIDIEWAREMAKKIAAPVSSPEEVEEIGEVIELAEWLRREVFVEAQEEMAERLGVEVIIVR